MRTAQLLAASRRHIAVRSPTVLVYYFGLTQVTHALCEVSGQCGNSPRWQESSCPTTGGASRSTAGSSSYRQQGAPQLKRLRASAWWMALYHQRGRTVARSRMKQPQRPEVLSVALQRMHLVTARLMLLVGMACCRPASVAHASYRVWTGDRLQGGTDVGTAFAVNGPESGRARRASSRVRTR
jgi:hypothetical protein